MKQCPVCQKPVSDFALECPHCKAKMDTKPQLTKTNHAEPVEKEIPAKEASPIKADYLSVVMLSLILFFISKILQNIETIYIGKFFGYSAMAVYSVVNNQISTIILTVFSALLISFAMWFYHRRSQSIKGFAFVSLAVIVVFALFHFVLSFLILPPQLFLNDSAVINQAKEMLPTLILFNALLYPGYVLISYWGVSTLGKKKGYLAAGIGALLVVIVMFLRAPLPMVMGLSWSAMYFFVFPIFAFLLYAGVLVIMKITTGRK